MHVVLALHCWYEDGQWKPVREPAPLLVGLFKLSTLHSPFFALRCSLLALIFPALLIDKAMSQAGFIPLVWRNPLLSAVAEQKCEFK